jgi:hypothetical protein
MNSDKYFWNSNIFAGRFEEEAGTLLKTLEEDCKCWKAGGSIWNLVENSERGL